MPQIVYANLPETILRKSAKNSASVANHGLLGTWLEVLQTD